MGYTFGSGLTLHEAMTEATSIETRARHEPGDQLRFISGRRDIRLASEGKWVVLDTLIYEL